MQAAGASSHRISRAVVVLAGLVAGQLWGVSSCAAQVAASRDRAQVSVVRVRPQARVPALSWGVPPAPMLQIAAPSRLPEGKLDDGGRQANVAGSFVGSLLGVAIGGAVGAGAAYLMDPDGSDDIELPLVLGPLIGGSLGGGFGAHLGNGASGNVGLASLAALGVGTVALIANGPSTSTELVLQVGLPMAFAAGAVAILTGGDEE